MLNEARLIGRLGADPEIVKTQNGKSKATLRVATWESFWNEAKKEWETISEWHQVVVWGDSAERLEKLKSGDLVLVIGKIKTHKYTDKNNIERYATQIVGIVKPIPKGTNKPKSEDNAPTEIEEPGDDLPF